MKTNKQIWEKIKSEHGASKGYWECVDKAMKEYAAQALQEFEQEAQNVIREYDLPEHYSSLFLSLKDKLIKDLK